jgi:pyrroloquinoline quinone biosynthesis protein A
MALASSNGRRLHRHMIEATSTYSDGGTPMQWTTPSFTDMRFGFEITMYIATR